jgi:RNA ligase
MKIDLDRIQKELDAGNITVRNNKANDLFIYNYSIDCQFKKRWNDISSMCRGLILDKEGNIIARPFPKFFNDGELPGLGIPIPNLPFEVFSKMDGSLGILYKYHNQHRFATRGSFHSIQSQMANKILDEKYSHVKFKDGITYLVEIIYPENRIVVDYNGLTDLILLAMIDIETGKDLPLEDIGLPIVEKFDGLKDLSKLKSLEIKNKEGYVIKFSNDFRMKIKFDEYVRLHRILTGLNEKHVWDYLQQGKDPLVDIGKNVPEEFLIWLEKVVNTLQKQYSEIEYCCMEHYTHVSGLNLKTRKEIAIELFKVCPKQYTSVVFNMIDLKDYRNIIWNSIKPKFGHTFSHDDLVLEKED